MKKVFFTCIMFYLAFVLASCNGCKNKNVEPKQDDMNVSAELVVENLVSMDRQDMFANYSQNYRWFETCILLEKFLDEEDCDGTVAGVSNIFQAVEEKGTGADVFVVMFSHTPDTSSVEVAHSFWVEDEPMNDEVIKLTFKDAFDRVMQTNSPKPHSRHVVLRKELGPIDANPQYIFGNQQAQLYVDAVTGEVRDTNPVYPAEAGFKMPLGEWP